MHRPYVLAVLEADGFLVRLWVQGGRVWAEELRTPPDGDDDGGGEPLPEPALDEAA